MRVDNIKGLNPMNIEDFSSEAVTAAKSEAARMRGAIGIRRAFRYNQPEEVSATIQTERVLSESHFAITTSGTVTLEAAHFGVPMVIFYRVGRLSYNLLGRWVIRTPHLSLVNILARRELVPELMPWWGDVKQLTQAAIDLLSDPERLVRTRADLLSLVAPLKAPPPATAAGNAADMVLELVR